MTTTERTAIIDLKALKATLHAVTPSETRYYLTGVCVEISPSSVTYVATDGHILFAAHREAPKGEDNTLTGTWIIPHALIKAVKLGRKLGETATLERSPIGGELLLRQDGASAVSFAPVDGTFPDWRRVVPAGQWEPLTPDRLIKSGNEVNQFDPALLARLQRAGQDLEMGKVPYVHHPEPGNPSVVTWPGYRDALGVIMPVRVADDPWTAPQWVTSTAAPKTA
jgi:DNA polymerase-3 subunit beta